MDLSVRLSVCVSVCPCVYFSVCPCHCKQVDSVVPRIKDTINFECTWGCHKNFRTVGADLNIHFKKLKMKGILYNKTENAIQSQDDE